MSRSSGRLPTQFETDRLILRSYTEEDASWYYQMSLRNREHLKRYESGNVAMSLTSERHTRKILGELATYWNEGTCYFVGAFAKTTAKFVAQVYVGPFNQVPAEFIIGYISDCAYEGQGFVTEAVAAVVESLFDHLNADRVRIHCNETNIRSRRVAERCGFRQESSFLEERKGSDGELHTGTTIVWLRLRRDRASS